MGDRYFNNIYNIALICVFLTEADGFGFKTSPTGKNENQIQAVGLNVFISCMINKIIYIHIYLFHILEILSMTFV